MNAKLMIDSVSYPFGDFETAGKYFSEIIEAIEKGELYYLMTSSDWASYISLQKIKIISICRVEDGQ